MTVLGCLKHFVVCKCPGGRDTINCQMPSPRDSLCINCRGLPRGGMLVAGIDSYIAGSKFLSGISFDGNEPNLKLYSVSSSLYTQNIHLPLIASRILESSLSNSLVPSTVDLINTSLGTSVSTNLRATLVGLCPDVQYR